jgi:hypothetical protein
MTKYLVSAACVAVLGMTAFAAPASADPNIGFGISVGGDGHRHHRRHDGYYGHHYGPGVRVYTGRSSYRDCDTKRVVKWRNGRKIVRVIRDCD